MNDLNCTDVNWNVLFPSRRGTVWWGLSIRAAWRSRSFWVSWRICGKSWREDTRGTVWSWRSPRSSTIRYMHLVFPWTFGMAYCLCCLKKIVSSMYTEQICHYLLCQQMPTWLHLSYLWFVTLHHKTSHNFWKLILVHKMKAE